MLRRLEVRAILEPGIAALAAVVVCASGFRECYKPVKRSGMPAHIKTIAVPAFQNQALRYRIETRFTDAVMNEVIRRGKGLRVQSEPEGAAIMRELNSIMLIETVEVTVHKPHAPIAATFSDVGVTLTRRRNG